MLHKLPLAPQEWRLHDHQTTCSAADSGRLAVIISNQMPPWMWAQSLLLVSQPHCTHCMLMGSDQNAPLEG